jgi:hypothetical protein
MLVFSHHRVKRRTIWLILVAWALALVAGVVNACLLQPQQLRAPASAASAHDLSVVRGMRIPGAFHVEHGDRADRAGGADGTMDAAQAGCVKFCNDESSTVTNAKTAQTDLPGPMLIASIDWRSTVPAAAVATWRSVERPVSQGPPLVIRFLRLTI